MTLVPARKLRSSKAKSQLLVNAGKLQYVLMFDD